MKSQSVTIAILVAAGVALFVATKSSYDSLSRARDQFYSTTGFAEGFVALKKAPVAIVRRIEQIAGIAVVEPRIVQEATLDFPGEKFPSAGRFMSLPINLSRLVIRSGTLPVEDNEVILSEAFAAANQLKPGSSLVAILNGKRKILKVTGTALSPEFVYIFRPGSLMPDDKHYGILWLAHTAMENHFDFNGALNYLAFTFAPNAKINSTLKLIDDALEPYGGLGSYTRGKLASYAFLRDEFKQLKANAVFLPLVFLGVAAFLLHIVATRLIARQREQIASLVALGYSKRKIVEHYLKQIMVISGSGALLGTVGGWYMGNGMTKLYGNYYRLPDLTHVFSFTVAVSGLVIGVGAGVMGAWFSVNKVVQLQPAYAMRPPLPEIFAPSFFEKHFKSMNTTTRMFLRNLLHRPMRTTLTILGLSTSVMIMIIGLFMTDIMDYMLSTQFELLSRESITVAFLRPVSGRVIDELRSKQGVQIAEGYRQAPVRLQFGQFVKEMVLTGIPPNAALRRIADEQGKILTLPLEGVLLNQKVAKKMGIRPGDIIELQVLEGNRRKIQTVVTSLADEIFGQNCYMHLDELSRLLGESSHINMVALRTDANGDDAIIAHLKNSPVVASVSTRAGALKAFYDLLSRSVLAMISIAIVFASVISVGVVYNTAMILLSERMFELGSLRILGFSRVEVFAIIAKELATAIFISLLPGCALGYLFALFLMNTVDTEEFTIKLIITHRTYVTAILVSLLTALLSLFILFLRIRNMDLVSVLKVRE